MKTMVEQINGKRIFILEGFASASQGEGLQVICLVPMRALPRSKESIYEKDHDETERRKGLKPGGDPWLSK